MPISTRASSTKTRREARRADIEREADFYGAMDGASKFVKGDAIAGIVITVINILGGFAVGVGQLGLPLERSAPPVHPAHRGGRAGHPDPGSPHRHRDGHHHHPGRAPKPIWAMTCRSRCSPSPKRSLIAAGVLLLFSVVPGPSHPAVYRPRRSVCRRWDTCRASASKRSRPVSSGKEAEKEAEEAKKPEWVTALLKLDRHRA